MDACPSFRLAIPSSRVNVKESPVYRAPARQLSSSSLSIPALTVTDTRFDPPRAVTPGPLARVSGSHVSYV
jgi:hypothetical protein